MKYLALRNALTSVLQPRKVISWRRPIAQPRFCDVIAKSLESGWATALHTFPNFLRHFFELWNKISIIVTGKKQSLWTKLVFWLRIWLRSIWLRSNEREFLVRYVTTKNVLIKLYASGNPNRTRLFTRLLDGAAILQIMNPCSTTQLEKKTGQKIVRYLTRRFKRML